MMIDIGMAGNPHWVDVRQVNRIVTGGWLDNPPSDHCQNGEVLIWYGPDLSFSQSFTIYTGDIDPRKHAARIVEKINKALIGGVE